MLSPYLLLQLLSGIGRNRAWHMIEQAGSPELALAQDPHTLSSLNAKARYELAAYQASGMHSPLAKKAQAIVGQLDATGAHLIDYEHSNYPNMLKTTVRPPLLLFVKGDATQLSMPQIAIVGPRKPSRSGEHNAGMFAQSLSEKGFVITSGLALGVDGVAHRAVVSIGRPTIAVMATGIEQVYPRRHQTLAQDIISNGGVLLTEFLPGTPPRAGHFPERNRIISGLSGGTLVIEAALKSGSLITARLACEQNRAVFALPGSIHNPQTKGTHALIKDGAILIDSPEDIADHLADVLGPIKACLPAKRLATSDEPSNLSDHEQRILKSLGYEATSADQLATDTGLSASAMASALMMLELKGLIQQGEWGFERIVSEPACG